MGDAAAQERESSKQYFETQDKCHSPQAVLLQSTETHAVCLNTGLPTGETWLEC